jgi:peptidoglycan LD-endopeptidase LytH
MINRFWRCARIESFRRRRRTWVLQILVLLILGIALWAGLHDTETISSDIYPYLTSIQPEIVLTSQSEGKKLSSTGWADLLAIRTSLTLDEQKFIISQLEAGKPFTKIQWKSDYIEVEKNKIEQVKRRRKIHLTYPYFEPGRFTFPVETQIWYTDTFGADREGGERRHEGTDIFGPEGTPLVSVCSGKIEKLGWNRLGGERVGVRGEDGNYYYYAHLQAIEPSLKVGQRIQKGSRIGTMGHTGDALTTPDHLHFGIELPNGSWINPYPFLYVWEQQKRVKIS